MALITRLENKSEERREARITRTNVRDTRSRKLHEKLAQVSSVEL